MSSPDFYSYGIWEQGDPLSDPEIFAAAEAEAYEMFRGVVGCDRKNVLRTDWAHDPARPGNIIHTDFYQSVVVDKNPSGESGVFCLCLTEERSVPRVPSQNRAESPTYTRQRMVVSQWVGKQWFEVAKFRRPELETSRRKIERVAAIVSPADLLNVNLDQELVEQTQYMDWLKIAKTSARRRPARI